MTSTPNDGSLALTKDYDDLKQPEKAGGQRFTQHGVRRLARLQARAQGAEEVAQAARNAADAAKLAFQEGLADACDEIGVSLPQGPIQAQIDWRTGDFAFTEGGPVQ